MSEWWVGISRGSAIFYNSNNPVGIPGGGKRQYFEEILFLAERSLHFSQIVRVWKKLLTTCNNLVGIIRLVTRLFHYTFTWKSRNLSVNKSSTSCLRIACPELSRSLNNLLPACNKLDDAIHWLRALRLVTSLCIMYMRYIMWENETRTLFTIFIDLDVNVSQFWLQFTRIHTK